MTAESHPFLTWLGQAGVIALGWLVVHKTTASRDKEKTRREALVKITDALAEDVNSILWDAHGYHTKGRSVVDELKLKSALQDLGIRVGGLSDIFSEQDVLAVARTQVGSLRRAVTGKHFEDEHTAILPDADPQLAVIVAAALDLKRTLLKIKNRQLQA